MVAVRLAYRAGVLQRRISSTHESITSSAPSRLIRSWNAAGWIDLSQRIGDKIAQLIGARAGEVIVADSTSINLFKALSAAVALNPGRPRRLTGIARTGL